MPCLLNLIYATLLAACSPFLLYRSFRTGRYREGWAEKFLGRRPAPDRRPALRLVPRGERRRGPAPQADPPEMARRRPGWEVVISTTTRTGLLVARRNYPDLVTFYAPLDFSWSARRAVARIRPTVLALVELELWPNLVWAAKAAGARVAIINGRLSHRSHRGYRKLRGRSARPSAGSTRSRPRTTSTPTGSSTSASPEAGSGSRARSSSTAWRSDRSNPRTLALRRALGLAPAELVFVAGSTMEGEEEAALTAYRAARRPTSPAPAGARPASCRAVRRVAAWLEARGERVVRRSSRTRPTVRRGRGQAPPVILVDSLGELSAVWGLADVAFVGGSLRPGRGGQNMMEPAAFGAAVLFGPYTSNFRSVVEQLLGCGGARVVADDRELTEALLSDLDDPEAAAARGLAASRYVLAQDGASGRTFAEIDRLVEFAPA